MRHSDLRTLARNLALDRDSAVSGSPAGTDVASIINDHVNWYAATRSDRSLYYTATGSGFAVTNGKFSALLAATDILRVLDVTRQSAADTIDGTPMDMVSPADIYHARSKSTTAGTPTMVAFVRMATTNKLRAIVHPPSSGTTNISIHYWPFERELTISPLSDSEVLDLPQHVQYAIVRETAYDIACILRQPDQLLESIAARSGPAEALTAGMLARNLGPNAPLEEPK